MLIVEQNPFLISLQQTNNMKFFYFFFILILLSCNNSDKSTRKVYEISKFDKTIIDSLIPLKNESYIGEYIKVVGFCDDTIKIQLQEGHFEHLLVGKVDTIFSTDYYGGFKVKFKFDPYKAKKGNLKLEFGIN